MKEEWGKWGIFEGAGVNGERAVGDAGPYGEVTRSAVGRADVGIGPYGEVTRSAVGRADVGIGPYEEVTRSAVSGWTGASAPTEGLPIEFRRAR